MSRRETGVLPFQFYLVSGSHLYIMELDRPRWLVRLVREVSRHHAHPDRKEHLWQTVLHIRPTNG